MDEEISKELFKMNIKLLKTHPFYDEFKNELKDMLDKCPLYKNKFEVLNCFSFIKITEAEKILKESH